MRRSERQGEWVTWAAMGLGVGILAGFALAEAVGSVDRERVERAVRRLGGTPAPAPLPPARAARAAAMALAEDLGLADLAIETVPLGPGQVELTGWVPDRRLRALAERTVASLQGITAVVNRLLVTDEDDAAGGQELSLADQSA